MRQITVTVLAAVVFFAGPRPDFVAPAAADSPPPFVDFTFKRSRVPSAGTRKRITVQIRETATVRPAARPSEKSLPATAPARPRSSYAFFWDSVPTAIDIAQSERMKLALVALKTAHNSGRNVLGHRPLLKAIAETYGDELEAAATRHRVSAALLLSVISIESAGKSLARSHKGAQGLMQLIPATAKRMGVSDVFDPAQNIDGGARYLDLLLTLFGEDALLALAGYNAGENAVLKSQGVPDYSETRDYVPKVLGSWIVARELCATPPRSVRAPCGLKAVFAPPSQHASAGLSGRPY